MCLAEQSISLDIHESSVKLADRIFPISGKLPQTVPTMQSRSTGLSKKAGLYLHTSSSVRDSWERAISEVEMAEASPEMQG